MHELFIQPAARTDIFERAVHYESREAGLGVRFDPELHTMLELILWNPRTFGLLEGHVRATKIGKFQDVLYYRIRKNTVNVIAVVHGRRHPSVWKRRLK